MTSISEGEHAQIVQDASVPVGVSPFVRDDIVDGRFQQVKTTSGSEGQLAQRVNESSEDSDLVNTWVVRFLKVGEITVQNSQTSYVIISSFSEPLDVAPLRNVPQNPPPSSMSVYGWHDSGADIMSSMLRSMEPEV